LRCRGGEAYQTARDGVAGIEERLGAAEIVRRGREMASGGRKVQTARPSKLRKLRKAARAGR